MSDDTHVENHAAQDLARSVGTVVRLTSITLGVVSVTLLATRASGLDFDQSFLQGLNLVEDFIGDLLAPIQVVIVEPIVRGLRELGVRLTLHDHWRYVFVLLWLLFGSFLRSLIYTVDTSLSGLLFRWIWPPVCSLIASLFAGSVPLDDPAVFWWPAAGYYLTLAGYDFWSAWEVGSIAERTAFVFAAACGFAAVNPIESSLLSHPSAFFVVIGLHALVRAGVGFPVSHLFVAAVAGIVAVDALPDVGKLLSSVRSPGLVSLAAFVALIGLGWVVRGWGDGIDESQWRSSGWDTTWLGKLRAFYYRLGLDILTVLSIAAVVVSIGYVLSR